MLKNLVILQNDTDAAEIGIKRQMFASNESLFRLYKALQVDFKG